METPSWTHWITCINATIVSASVVWKPLAKPHNVTVMAARGVATSYDCYNEWKDWWMIEWLNKLDVRKLCAATVWTLGLHEVCVIHSFQWYNDLGSMEKTLCSCPRRPHFSQSYPRIHTFLNSLCPLFKWKFLCFCDIVPFSVYAFKFLLN